MAATPGHVEELSTVTAAEALGLAVVVLIKADVCGTLDGLRALLAVTKDGTPERAAAVTAYRASSKRSVTAKRRAAGSRAKRA